MLFFDKAFSDRPAIANAWLSQKQNSSLKNKSKKVKEKIGNSRSSSSFYARKAHVTTFNKKRPAGQKKIKYLEELARMLKKDRKKYCRCHLYIRRKSWNSYFRSIYLVWNPGQWCWKPERIKNFFKMSELVLEALAHYALLENLLFQALSRQPFGIRSWFLGVVVLIFLAYLLLKAEQQIIEEFSWLYPFFLALCWWYQLHYEEFQKIYWVLPSVSY